MSIFWPSAVEDDEDEDEELAHTRKLVAFHESGHAAACNKLRIPYSEIHVSVNRTYWTGQLRYSGYVMTAPTDDTRAIDYATMSLAGKEAEALYLMEHLGWRKGKARSFAEDHAGTDLRHAEEAVGRRGLYDAERRARRLVEASWSSITKLARQL